MEFLKVQFGIYDFLSILLPGAVFVCEVWIGVKGWGPFTEQAREVKTGVLLTLLLLSYGVGHLAQEIPDKAFKLAAGERFFMQERDCFLRRFLVEEKSDLLRRKLEGDLGPDVIREAEQELQSKSLRCGKPHVDLLFESCLARIEGRFPKGDVFIATSDLCRAFLLLVVVGIWTTARVIRDASKRWAITRKNPRALIGWASFVAALVLVVIASMSYTRMIRFRATWQDSVFYIYLGQPNQPK
jgi:hypothetical protein